jgi:hypothetical protein
MTTVAPRPQVGMRFIHAGYCKGELRPQCIVSRVSDTTVSYWTERGRKASCDILVFGSKVSELVTAHQELPPVLPDSWREVLFMAPA